MGTFNTTEKSALALTRTPNARSTLARRQSTQTRWAGLCVLQTSDGSEPGALPVRAGRAGRVGRVGAFACGCARDRSLVLGTHFAQPTAGQVVPAGEVWQFKVL